MEPLRRDPVILGAGTDGWGADRRRGDRTLCGRFGEILFIGRGGGDRVDDAADEHAGQGADREGGQRAPAAVAHRREMGILEELLVADGGVVSTEDLLERVWDENADPFIRTVTVTIGRLRRKLSEPDPIDTVVGSGYRLP